MASIPAGGDRGRVGRSRDIMEWFTRSTGLAGEFTQRHYLWTDAFAVCTALAADGYLESRARPETK